MNERQILNESQFFIETQIMNALEILKEHQFPKEP